MWNSPHRQKKAGKRYKVNEIDALVYPLDLMLDLLEAMPVSDVVSSKFLSRLEKDEFIFATFEVFQALLEDVPVPKGGHPGYQEAIVDELLGQTHTRIVEEFDNHELGDSARKAALASYLAFFGEVELNGNISCADLSDLNLELSSPAGRDAAANAVPEDRWEEMLRGEGGLPSEFLWDYDWEMDWLMDLPADVAKRTTDFAGLSLETVHKLPHSPTPEEARMAKNYLHYVIWRAEARWN